MIKVSSPSLRAAFYALRGGFLVRPMLIAVALGAAGAVLSSLEESHPALRALVPKYCFHPMPTHNRRRQFSPVSPLPP